MEFSLAIVYSIRNTSVLSGHILPAPEMKYFYSYCLNGCLGFVKTWLETGEKETPEYAAEMAYRMVVSSVTAFYDTKEGREDN